MPTSVAVSATGSIEPQNGQLKCIQSSSRVTMTHCVDSQHAGAVRPPHTYKDAERQDDLYCVVGKENCYQLLHSEQQGLRCLWSMVMTQQPSPSVYDHQLFHAANGEVARAQAVLNVALTLCAARTPARPKIEHTLFATEYQNKLSNGLRKFRLRAAAGRSLCALFSASDHMPKTALK
jgi:hypothetical protein